MIKINVQQSIFNAQFSIKNAYYKINQILTKRRYYLMGLEFINQYSILNFQVKLQPLCYTSNLEETKCSRENETLLKQKLISLHITH